jgi:hypothetical protein
LDEFLEITGSSCSFSSSLFDRENLFHLRLANKTIEVNKWEYNDSNTEYTFHCIVVGCLVLKRRENKQRKKETKKQRKKQRNIETEETKKETEKQRKKEIKRKKDTKQERKKEKKKVRKQ